MQSLKAVFFQNDPKKLFAKAIKNGDVEEVIKRIKIDKDLIKCYEGDSPLYTSIIANNFSICKILIENGMNVNEQYELNKWDIITPLYVAVENNKFQFAKLFIENGADVNLGYNSPITIAISNSNLQIFKLLISNGAYLNSADDGDENFHLVDYPSLVPIVKF
eukprot:TRINITY_DN769_c0_g4_i1.p1 TRINITY_DN769_c0_g4~~TRINITY_DN769_c0_g4_i1.p1  ORF type:complete len:182 (-),score=50.36 TRINITY_DN769_c0_g4_i1:38-526(-)